MTPGIGEGNAVRRIRGQLRRRLHALQRANHYLYEAWDAQWKMRDAARQLLKLHSPAVGIGHLALKLIADEEMLETRISDTRQDLLKFAELLGVKP